MPGITIIDGAGHESLTFPELRAKATGALDAVLASIPGQGDAPLRLLDEVEATLVSDVEIALIHDEFMGDPSPTDVITFQHGEVLISQDTARSEATRRNWPEERELLLYLIHGLLHLHGHEDGEPGARQRMWTEQEAILNQLWPLRAD